MAQSGVCENAAIFATLWSIRFFVRQTDGCHADNPPWCNGSTAAFEAVCLGSNPGGGANSSGVDFRLYPTPNKETSR